MAIDNKESKLDATDILIIQMLSENARQATSAIAAAIGMSAPSVAERIRRLEETGVISKFTVKLNYELIGYPFSAIVRVKPLPGKMHILQQRLIEIPHCTQCDKVTGDDCFIARLSLRSIPELDEVLDKIVELAETSTSIIKQSPISDRLPKL